METSKIKSYYKPETNDNSLWFTFPKKVRIPFSKTQKIVLTLGEKISSLEEAEKRGITITTGQELYRLLAPELYENLIPDTRSTDYLEKIKQSIGLVEVVNGHDGVKFEKKFGLSVWMNLTGSGEVDCGKNASGNWVAEYSMRTAIDDYIIVSMIFNRKPTEKMVSTCELIGKIEMHLALHPKVVTFNCWECGRKTHWLDTEGSLSEKWEHFQEQYCGC